MYLKNHPEIIIKEAVHMYNYKIVEQVKRKQKKSTRFLRKIMLVFAVFFLLLGIMISQGFMLPGFLLVVLYFFYDIFSQKEYEYTMEEGSLTIDIILGRRHRKTAHILDLNSMIVTAPSTHTAVDAYRKGTGTIRLPKYDYTSYEEDTPYYTMIIMENSQKIKLLLDLSEDMLQTLKKRYPDKVYL